MKNNPDSLAYSRRFRKWVKPFASIKIAVCIILALGCVTAVGTFVESHFQDSAMAVRLVYHSVYMYAVLGALCLNLIAVMIDRWPWKQKHAGFVLAHIGILVLLFGAWVTQNFGVDGSLSMGVGEKSNSVVVSEEDFTVYTSLNGQSYAKIYDFAQSSGKPVDFYLLDPKKNPLKIQLPDGEIRVVDYLPFALRDEKVTASESKEDGPAVRFQLTNANVNVTDWILHPGRGKSAVRDLGPAQVVLTTEEFQPTGRNEIVLRPEGDGISYAIYSKREPKNIKKGLAHAGDTIETGWMGMVLRILKFLPNAKNEIKFVPLPAHTDLTTEAIKIEFAETATGKVTPYWFAVDSLIKLFTENAVYITTYSHRRLKLDFELQLNQFTVGRYPGTARAASYESVVSLLKSNQTAASNIHISMNEPLKHSGYTFYQSSFNEDEQGRPIASILSVNSDPGRWIKYLGCLIIVSGIIQLFYFKSRLAKSRPPASPSQLGENSPTTLP